MSDVVAYLVSQTRTLASCKDNKLQYAMVPLSRTTLRALQRRFASADRLYGEYAFTLDRVSFFEPDICFSENLVVPDESLDPVVDQLYRQEWVVWPRPISSSYLRIGSAVERYSCDDVVFQAVIPRTEITVETPRLSRGWLSQVCEEQGLTKHGIEI